MSNNLKRFLYIALGGLIGASLYGIGQYLITGHTDIEYQVTFTITWLIGGAIGYLILIKMIDL
ncbi:MAG TPA: hypothetical protein DER33_01800 [Syntrophomonas sp.]|jgi:hypothetical protein|nr:hypothetical protein [Syntrophomonas sp.]HCF70322.1 hypothetical protein [Syntrophomonas sp.]